MVGYYQYKKIDYIENILLYPKGRVVYSYVLLILGELLLSSQYQILMHFVFSIGVTMHI